MDYGEWKELISVFIKKYRWTIAVILSGIMLMAIPGRDSEKNTEYLEKEADFEVSQESVLQQELEMILCKLDGAGKVSVLLTFAHGAETHYQTNKDSSETSDSVDNHLETVLISDSGRGESGLIRRIDSPIYRGAVVLCQGAASAQVRLAIVDAVATATGLTSDKISVCKMK